MTERQSTKHEEYPELTREELEAQHAEELPERHALSVLRVPFLGNPPVEAAEPDLPDGQL